MACDGDIVGTPEPDTTFLQVTAGDTHTCALDEQNRAWCWGEALWGRLGAVPDQSLCEDGFCTRPVSVIDGLGFQTLDAGGTHTCGVRAGTVHCWGMNWRGQLGDAGTNSEMCGDYWPACATAPSLVGVGYEATGVTAGASHSCAVTRESGAFCWGYNVTHQLGAGVPPDATDRPAPVVAGEQFVEITAGTAHTCAIDRDGHAWCWGGDFDGRLGQGVVQSATWPQPVTGDPLSSDPAERERLTWTDIDAGNAHTCGVSTAGIAYCWGRGGEGALGDGRGVDSTTPVQAVLPGATVQVSAGGGHSCAVQASGEAWCWGNNEAGQLGDGTSTQRLEPVRVELQEPVSMISAGERHTCAVTDQGRIYCWGEGAAGQLGTGDRNDNPLPRPLFESP